MKQHNEISHYIHELRQAVTAASINYEIWWVYKSEDTRPQFIDSMRHYNLFFVASIHAHFVALLTALYRLYETRKDTYNIRRLLRLLRESSLLSNEDLNELDRIFASAHPLWVKVSVLRNEAFGHRSTDASVFEVFEKAAITPFELADLINTTQQLLKYLTYAWDRDTCVFDHGARDDVIDLLNDLSKFHQRHTSTDPI